MAQEGKRSRVGSVNDDAGDDQAKECDHQHVGDVAEQLSAGKVVTRNRGQEAERGVRMLDLAARTTQPGARVDVHGALTAVVPRVLQEGRFPGGYFSLDSVATRVAVFEGKAV